VENINQENIESSGLGTTVPSSSLVKYPSPNNPPWGVLSAIGLWLFSVLLIVILPGLFLLPYLFSQNFDFSDSKVLEKFSTTDPTAVLVQIGSVFPAHILTMILAWFIITKFNKHSFKEMLGWDWGGYKWWQTGVITLGLLVGLFIFFYLMVLTFGANDNELMKILRSSRYAVFVVAIMATFSAPIVEEVVYRGVLYSALQRAVNIPFAVVLTSFLFASVHYFQYWGDVATIVNITVLSLLITLIRVKTNSILPCIFFHFVFNGIQSVILILQPYFPEVATPAKVEGLFFLIK
jgi:membrane protease YdiL (CAAX protease family)